MAEFEKILIEFFTGDGMTVARTVAVFIFGLLAVKLIPKSRYTRRLRDKVT